MVVERVSTSHKVADEVCSEAAGPLNDITSDVNSLMEEYIGHDDLRQKLQAIADNANTSARTSLRQGRRRAEQHSGRSRREGRRRPDPRHGLHPGRRWMSRTGVRTTIGANPSASIAPEVTIACCGSEAISCLEQNAFDLVVSDIKMPDKTGYDVFAAARIRSETLPVILMTGFGYDPNHSIVRASQEGLSAVLFKPFKVDQLLSEVRKAIQSQPVQ